MMLFDAWLASWIKEAEAKKEAPAAAANKRKPEEMEAEKKARLRRQRLLGEAVAPRGPLLTSERDFRVKGGC